MQKGKKSVQMPEDWKKAWDEAVMCYHLIKQKKAKIVTTEKEDGEIYRYTKIKRTE